MLSAMSYTFSTTRLEKTGIDPYGQPIEQYADWLFFEPCLYTDLASGGETVNQATKYTQGQYTLQVQLSTDILLTDRVTGIFNRQDQFVDPTIKYYNIKQIAILETHKTVVLEAVY